MVSSLAFMFAAATLAPGAQGAPAQAPSDLLDLVYARAAGGDTQMQMRGYRFVRTTTGGTAKWSLWWNDRNRQCVQITTSNGRYSAINSVPSVECGQRDDYRGRNDRDRDDDRRPSRYPPDNDGRPGAAAMTTLMIAAGR
ncbi:hypothetical protein H3Z74_10325 [Sphingomonas alpina]|uniref:Secreted protein n=2 Tax=Sphingomonas alpina TaxID=653931 RepID=A0A7H0LP85_9SPHN|nr:hypothetical protein H3Z74_10325 [Sphingomonas alpina]